MNEALFYFVSSLSVTKQASYPRPNAFTACLTVAQLQASYGSEMSMTGLLLMLLVLLHTAGQLGPEYAFGFFLPALGVTHTSMFLFEKVAKPTFLRLRI